MSTQTDIPVFGEYVVYDSPELAVASLVDDDVVNQLTRLVQVANNRQLKTMLQPGLELCRPGAMLYLRVSKMCPLYWVKWGETEANADLDLVSEIPQLGARKALLAKVADVGGAPGVLDEEQGQLW